MAKLHVMSEWIPIQLIISASSLRQPEDKSAKTGKRIHVTKQSSCTVNLPEVILLLLGKLCWKDPPDRRQKLLQKRRLTIIFVPLSPKMTLIGCQWTRWIFALLSSLTQIVSICTELMTVSFLIHLKSVLVLSAYKLDNFILYWPEYYARFFSVPTVG